MLWLQKEGDAQDITGTYLPQVHPLHVPLSRQVKLLTCPLTYWLQAAHTRPDILPQGAC